MQEYYFPYSRMEWLINQALYDGASEDEIIGSIEVGIEIDKMKFIFLNQKSLIVRRHRLWPTASLFLNHAMANL